MLILFPKDCLYSVGPLSSVGEMAVLNFMLPFLYLMGADDNLDFEALVYNVDVNSLFIWLLH